MNFTKAIFGQPGYIEGSHLHSSQISPETLLLGVIFERWDIRYVERCLSCHQRRKEAELAHQAYIKRFGETDES